MFRKTERTARKGHRCYFCAGAITAGSRYIDGFWILEGEPSPWKAHLDCQELAGSYPEDYGGVPPFRDWEPKYDLCDMPAARAEFDRLVARACA